MWLAVLLSALGDNTNGLTLSVWEFTVMIENHVADLTSIWACQSSVENDFSLVWVLWLVKVVWWLTSIVPFAFDNAGSFWSVFDERSKVGGSRLHNVLDGEFCLGGVKDLFLELVDFVLETFQGLVFQVLEVFAVVWVLAIQWEGSGIHDGSRSSSISLAL